jgi:orotate phosphoribosyltransferase
MDFPITNILHEAALWVIALSTFLLALEVVGLLPDRVSRFINRNRLALSLQILRELGVDVREVRRATLTARIKAYFAKEDNYSAQAKARLDNISIKSEVELGQERHSRFSSFVDLMGASTKPDVAIWFAKILSTHLRRLIQSGEIDTDFDAIACPKDGSPILAYEFAKLMAKPLILCPVNAKFSGREDLATRLVDVDPAVDLAAIRRVLLIDDSTTGGRKALNVIHTLRRLDIDTNDFLVVFEPKGKNARGVLQENGVRLHSVTEGPSGVV